ncbi:PIG-L family deacetylase [Streptomyces triculaminicus]|uniref:PIG-L family deacetylase n=3 Tax=Streptomyces TaxID=1883 RepID=A0A939FUI1_9ACTN|nr:MULTISPECIES: PIG-L family deacetylase [Streptomyces]MBO0656227.1 PIG-L family deacetylase [Streptomyces triculaminicus]QSY50216.1 PIG-L family deacetylase [Streptomyces griseocarneus]
MDDLLRTAVVLPATDRRPPHSVLVIGSHPADIALHAGGTLARWVERGTRATYCVLTGPDGEDGTPAEFRRAGQRLAAKLCGVTDVRFLGRGELAAVVQDSRPGRVLAPGTDPLEEWAELEAVPELWLTDAPEPNQYVDVTAVLERKLDALRSDAAWAASGADPEERLRERLAAHARAGGLPQGRLAEAFQVLRPVRRRP